MNGPRRVQARARPDEQPVVCAWGRLPQRSGGVRLRRLLHPQRWRGGSLKRGVKQRVCHRFGPPFRDLRAQGDSGQGVGKRRLNTHERRGGANSLKIFERQDVLMEEIPSKNISKMSASGSTASRRLTAWTDGDEMDGEMDMLDAEVLNEDEYAPQQSSESDGVSDKVAVHDAEDGDDDDDNEDAAAQEEHQGLPDSTMESSEDGAQEPRRSKPKPAPKVTWWESKRKAYLAEVPFADAKSAWDLSEPRTNAKKEHARSNLSLWKAAEKDEYLAHGNLVTWSKIKNSNKRKAVKTRYVYDINRDSEGNVTRCKARLVA